MRVVVSLLHHFRMTPDGTVYPYSVFDYTFWKRYLDVFDEVIVFARVGKIDNIEPAITPAKSSGPGVTFVELPDFLGAWQYLKAYHRLKPVAKKIVTDDNAFVLRIPGYLSTMLWRELKKQNRPYAVEVVGDPWQALSPGSFPSILRPFIRRTFAWEMKQQCRNASLAAYVTERELQKRYPPGGWSTYYSSIELPAKVILDEPALEQRIERIETKAKSNGPWQLCFMGSLWHLAKAPDVVIDAVADCVKKGFNLELTMLGDGSLRSQLEAQVHRRGIANRVRFLGHLPPGKAIYEQLDKADIFVLPSRSEGLPKSIIEAFARGVPCIGGYAGGFVELLEDRHIVKPICSTVLSHTIERMVSDVDEMKKAVKRNAKKAAEYRSDILQSRRIKLYSKLKSITQDWLNNKR